MYFKYVFPATFLVNREKRIVTNITKLEKIIRFLSSTSKNPILSQINIIGPIKQNKGKSYAINLLTFFSLSKK